MPPVVCGMAVIGSKNAYLADQFRIRKARADARFDLVQRDVGSHHQRQAVDVAVVYNLKEFFLCPGSGRLRTEVIQHQQGRCADLLEPLLKGDILRVEGKPQQVQQIGNGQEECRHPHAHCKVGNRSRQMGLAAAIPSLQKQPALERAGVLAGGIVGNFKRARLAFSQANLAAWLKRIESQVFKFIQMAKGEEPVTHVPCHRPLPACAYLQSAKIGGTRLDVAADVAESMAVWTVRVAQGLNVR